MEDAKRQYRILLVDDDDDYRESMFLLLENEDYMIKQADDAPSAKQMLTATAFHLCLLDLQMPDDSGELKDDTGLEVAKWMIQHCFYTSRIILTSHEKIEFVKRAIRERLVQGYYAKGDVASGVVGSLSELVANTFAERLVTVSLKNEMPLKVDALEFWDEVGLVERDLHENARGVVRFKSASVMAHIHRAAGVSRIRTGTEVIGRAVFGGEVEVLPVTNVL
jgi:CheY-like chemotaxis protein